MTYCFFSPTAIPLPDEIRQHMKDRAAGEALDVLQQGPAGAKQGN